MAEPTTPKDPSPHKPHKGEGVPIKSLEAADAKNCHKYDRGYRPSWVYYADESTIWCDNPECRPSRCGLCTLGPWGKPLWPWGFEEVSYRGLPLLEGL